MSCSELSVSFGIMSEGDRSRCCISSFPLVVVVFVVSPLILFVLVYLLFAIVYFVLDSFHSDKIFNFLITIWIFLYSIIRVLATCFCCGHYFLQLISCNPLLAIAVRLLLLSTCKICLRPISMASPLVRSFSEQLSLYFVVVVELTRTCCHLLSCDILFVFVLGDGLQHLPAIYRIVIIILVA